MIIVGYRGISKTTGHGTFFCPACQGESRYTQITVRRWLTLYFIPLIPADIMGEYVQCSACGSEFKPEVLSLRQPPAAAPSPTRDAHGALPPAPRKPPASTVPDFHEPSSSGGSWLPWLSIGGAGLGVVFLAMFCLLSMVLFALSKPVANAPAPARESDSDLRDLNSAAGPRDGNRSSFRPAPPNRAPFAPSGFPQPGEGDNASEPTTSPPARNPVRTTPLKTEPPPTSRPPTEPVAKLAVTDEIKPRLIVNPLREPKLADRILRDGFEPTWNVQVDPPQTSWDLDLPEGLVVGLDRNDDVLFPPLISPFLFILKVRETTCDVVDVRTKGRAGRIASLPRTTGDWAASSDGKYLANRPSGNVSQAVVQIWSPQIGGSVGEVRHARGGFVGVKIFSGSRLITSMLSDENFQVWDLSTGKKLPQAVSPTLPAKESATVSPGGRYFAIVCNNKAVWVAELETGKTAGLAALPPAAKSSLLFPNGLAFSRDGKFLAGVFGDGLTWRVLCWDVATGKLVQDFTVADVPLNRAAVFEGRDLEWIGNDGWLLYAQVIVDRHRGQITGSLAEAKYYANRNIARMPLDGGKLLLVSGERQDRGLYVEQLPETLRPQPR